MDYIKFANHFYNKNIIPLNKAGLKRTLQSFHLVDMFPSLKAMEKFYNTNELVNVVNKCDHINKQASIYIHFPFCKNTCSYCHLYRESVDKLRDLESDYINSIEKEIELYTKILGKKIEARSVYFGGGTPSLMNTRTLKKLLRIIRRLFIIPKDSFSSFEIYPESNFDRKTLLEKLRLLKSFGIKEVVLDIQSTNLRSLREVGRGNTDFSSWKKIAKLIKYSGISRIKTSIIIGLPLDNLKSLEKSVFDITGVKEVTTISLFLLEFREGLRIFDELINSRYKFCDNEERDKMQTIARRILTDKGFHEFPIHFFNREINKDNSGKIALIGTHKDHLLGFGPSSYGHLVLDNYAIKYYNYSDIYKYISRLNQQNLPISRWYKLDREEQAVSKIIDDINSGGVIDKDILISQYNHDIKKKLGNVLNTFERLKLIRRENNKRTWF